MRTKILALFLCGLLVTLGGFTTNENAIAQTGWVTDQMKDIPISNLELNQIEIRQKTPKSFHISRCPDQFHRIVGTGNREFVGMGETLVFICEEFRALVDTISEANPTRFSIYIPLKALDGKMKSAYWQINSFLELEKILSFLKESKISHLKVEVSRRLIVANAPDSSVPQKSDGIDPSYATEGESDVMKEMKKSLEEFQKTPSLCESCKVLGFTLAP